MDVKSITLSSLMVALICLAAATGIVLLWSFKWSCSPLSQIPFSDGVSLYLIKGWFEKGILHGNRQYRINERWFCRRFSGNGNSTGGNSRRQKDNQEVQILLRGLQGSCLLLLPGPWYPLPSWKHGISLKQDSMDWAFFSPNPWKIQFPRLVPHQIPTQCLLPVQLLAPVQRSLSLSWWTALRSRQMKGSVFKC